MLDRAGIQEVVWRVERSGDQGAKDVVFLPTVDANGRDVPVASDDGSMHHDSALLVRTHLFSERQTLTTNRFSIMWHLLHNFDFGRAAQGPQGLVRLPTALGRSTFGARADKSKRRAHGEL